MGNVGVYEVDEALVPLNAMTIGVFPSYRTSTYLYQELQSKAEDRAKQNKIPA